MALTSQQKHYIKKNIGRMTPDEMALNLKMSPKEVAKFIKKHWGEEKFKKFSRNNKDSSEYQENPEKIKDFLLENINYFILFFVLIGLAYFNSLHNQFVSDDIATILKNPQIGDLKRNFTNYLVGEIHDIFDFFIYKLAGIDPLPYRLINILFHFGSTSLLFIIVSYLVNRRVALIAASLFAVHPMLIEAVGWISGAPYAFYGFFSLLAFLLYLRSSKNKRLYYLSFVAFILGIISSDRMMVFPMILVAYELSQKTLRKNWKRLIIFFSIDILLVVKTFFAIGNRISALQNTFYQQDASGMQNPFIKIPTAIATYLKLIFWPDKLSLYQTELNYDYLGFSFCVLIFLIYLGLVLYGWKKNKMLFFWLSLFFIVLTPALTPLKVAWVVAERYSYLATVGIIVAFAMYFVSFMEKSDDERRPIYYGTMILIVVALMTRTYFRNIDWKNEDNLWTATVKVSPSGAPIHNNMGDVYARHQDYQNAIKEFTRATEINPGYADAYHNLANTYQVAGQPDLAEKYYLKALSINPNIWQSYQNLAAIYYNMGDRQKALENMQKAITINPTDPGLQNNLQIIQGGAPITP